MRNRGRTRLRFQPKTAGNDGFGPNPSAGGYGEGVAIGVLLKPASGKEQLENGVVASEQAYTIEVRSSYFEGEGAIDATWRVRDEAKGVTYNIVAIAANDLDYRWTRVTIESASVP